MHRDRVAKTWLYRGLCDLLFAFDSDDVAFEDNARFSEIMGVEKVLKAVLLYHRHSEYEHLPLLDARRAVNRLAMDYGHKFESMLKELSALGLSDIERIRRGGYDGYVGNSLVEALNKGYMETRYPIPVPVSASFPIGSTGFTHDPLSSSGMTKFVYALSNACIFSLAQSVDLSDMRAQFGEQFAHLESLPRFNNLFWEARCRA
jgi:hypothetical protein